MLKAPVHFKLFKNDINIDKIDGYVALSSDNYCVIWDYWKIFIVTTENRKTFSIFLKNI